MSPSRSPKAQGAFAARRWPSSASRAGDRPARILTLGGDCLVDLPPIAYLNTRYVGKLSALWVDSHPDVMTRRCHANPI
ncbi:MAG TPA: arginase family protein [Roseiarcus sp.]|jgi:arginase